MVTDRLKTARERIHQLGTHSVESRIAAALLKLAEKLGEQQDGMLLIQLPLSRQDLADMTGTQVETASRIMSQFRKDGLIRTGRRWVTITGATRLSAIAAARERRSSTFHHLHNPSAPPDWRLRSGGADFH